MLISSNALPVYGNDTLVIDGHKAWYVRPWIQQRASWSSVKFAMQVLGNAELRDRYDKHGAQALDVNFMDASEFFMMLFGSDKFEHLVGELMIAAAARNGGDFSFAQIKKLQVTFLEPMRPACGMLSSKPMWCEAVAWSCLSRP